MNKKKYLPIAKVRSLCKSSFLIGKNDGSIKDIEEIIESAL